MEKKGELDDEKGLYEKKDINVRTRGLDMFFDINGIVKIELDSIRAIIDRLELSNQTGNVSSEKGFKDGIEGEMVCLNKRCTSKGDVYDLRIRNKGRRMSKKLGGPDNDEVIKFKQSLFNDKMLKILKEDLKLLRKVEGKFLPYDPDSIDRELKEVYRDRTGLVNKAPGIVDLDEWVKIDTRNSYPLSEKSNVTTDGMKTRSKSELIIYGILKGYVLVLKYDMEIKLKDETGQVVTVCPDFVILCSDGSLIIIEHLGMLDDVEYLKNALRRLHLYMINGFRLNENLFLTADYALGKINAQVINEMVRKMILPRVH